MNPTRIIAMDLKAYCKEHGLEKFTSTDMKEFGVSGHTLHKLYHRGYIRREDMIRIKGKPIRQYSFPR